MFTQVENKFVDIETINADTQQRLSLCVASDRSVRRVMELAATRLGMTDAVMKLDSLQIRREGDLLPLDCDGLVGNILRPGDRLIVERAAGSGREAASVDDAFRSAAAQIAGDAVSADSATFLSRARQPLGE